MLWYKARAIRKKQSEKRQALAEKTQLGCADGVWLVLTDRKGLGPNKTRLWNVNIDLKILNKKL